MVNPTRLANFKYWLIKINNSIWTKNVSKKDWNSVVN